MEKDALEKLWKKRKEEYPHCIIFLFGASFLTTYNEDAQTASNILDITFTKTNLGTPLAGFHVRLAKQNIQKLISKGYSVAVVAGHYTPKNAIEEQEEEELIYMKI